MSVQIRVTLTDEIDKLLDKVAKKLGKKKSVLIRELMEQKLYDLKLIQNSLEDLKL
ncbi:MAG: ribbon-helix-helix protein, CopG family [Nanoarchaeota archaeon]|nr:ribbon-helix-helix protein, CopG family [Nanoarchaeota archaeon]MBU1703909.1 ribbon-helix-helix protein, CopG family [Nanoarchaeota archaeon]